MDNSIYIALSRQTALFREINLVANNISNVDTTGYQAEKMLFTKYMVDDGNRNKMAFTQDIASYRDTAGGPLRVTGNALDVAISGSGFFQVETPQGRRYTRAGNFQMDGNGTLITAEGHPVLDDGGQPVEFAPEDREIAVHENGAVVVDGEERAVLGVVEFENPQAMTQVGGALFATDQEPVESDESRVLHGVLEKSNVVGVSEIVRMVELQRSVASTAKFIEVMYDLQRKTNNTYAQNSG